MQYGLIIQARYNSTRLPGKVLKKIGKHTILNILIKRLSKLNKNYKIIVATGTSKNDDKINDYLKKKRFQSLGDQIKMSYLDFLSVQK